MVLAQAGAGRFSQTGGPKRHWRQTVCGQSDCTHSRWGRTPNRLSCHKPIRQTVSKRLPEPLTAQTVLVPKQASSQQLRTFFIEAIGQRFSYDIHMRTFLASNETKTLGAAVAHWYATRNTAKPETLPQLELVRFTKAWHRAHPAGTQVECRAAWKRYKSLPVDERESLEPLKPSSARQSWNPTRLGVGNE